MTAALTACGTASSTATPLEPQVTATASPTTDEPTESSAADATESVTRTLAGGRSYLLHDPRPSTEPRPLVVVLHSALHTNAWMEEATGFSRLADERDVVVAYPSGAGLVWNAGGCCGDRSTDDVGYLRAVVDDVRAATAVDRSRVYVVGLSNGGMMAYRAVCELPDLFTAAGVVAGTLLDRVDCTDTHVRVYAIHGSADQVVPISGGTGFRGCYFPSQASIADRLGRGSLFQPQIWSGGHEYPSWATDVLWTWFSKLPVAFQASASPPGC